MAQGGQFNRIFVVGLAGATLVSLGFLYCRVLAARLEVTGVPNSTRPRTATLVNNRLHGLSVRTSSCSRRTCRQSSSIIVSDWERK